MKTQTFTFLELMNVIEGVATTSDSVDVSQRILSHLFNRSVYTHEIPFYISKLKGYNPMWLAALRTEISTMKVLHMTKTSIFDFRSKKRMYQDFVKIIERDMNYDFEVPQLKEYI